MPQFTLTSARATATPVIEGVNEGRSYALVNRDLVNHIIIGQDSGISSGLASNINEYSIIDPLGSITLDDSNDWYAGVLEANASAVLDKIPGGSNWAPSPAQVAAQINALGLAKDTSVNAPGYGPITTSNPGTLAKDATVTGVAKDSSLTTINGTLGTPAQDSIRTAIPTNISTTGVPLLGFHNNNINLTSKTLTAGSTFTSSTITIGQIGYDIAISMQAAASSTSPYFKVQLNWTDSTTSLTVAREEWWLAASASTSTDLMRYRGSGPSKGDTLVITIKSTDTVNLTYSLSFSQTSRVKVRDDWRCINAFVQIPNFSAAGVAEPSDVIASTNPSVANGASVTRFLGLFAGQVSLQVTPPATQAYTVNIQTLSLAQSESGAAMPALNLYSVSPAAGVVVNATVVLPRCICTIVIINNGTTTGTWSAEMVVQEALP